MATQKLSNSNEILNKSIKGFDQMAVGMQHAVEEFKDVAPQDDFFSFLQPVTEMGSRAVRFTAEYSRRHPIRMAISVAALGLMASQILRIRSSNKDS